MKAYILRFAQDESAATAIEYGLIAAGIALAIIATVNGPVFSFMAGTGRDATLPLSAQCRFAAKPNNTLSWCHHRLTPRECQPYRGQWFKTFMLGGRALVRADRSQSATGGGLCGRR
jgi:Flp pilus assembly pilin Flp